MEPTMNLHTTMDFSRRASLVQALNNATAVREPSRRSVEIESDETLVEDRRDGLRPAQCVEQKLVAMLQTAPVFVSHLQKDARPRAR